MPTETATRTGVLAALNEGDRVALQGGYSRRWTITTIDKVLPSGRLRIGSRLFGADGHERGGSDYAKAMARPVTEAIEASVRRDEALTKCGAIRFDTLTTDALEAILATAKNGKATP